jgi:hypothetical protein
MRYAVVVLTITTIQQGESAGAFQLRIGLDDDGFVHVCNGLCAQHGHVSIDLIAQQGDGVANAAPAVAA